MIRRGGAAFAVAGLAAGCGYYVSAQGPDEPRSTKVRGERKQPGGRIARHAAGRARVYVSVVDGDRRHVVRRARVALGRRTVRVSKRGIATLHIARRALLRVTAWAPGYEERTVPISFRRRSWATVRLYRRSLQWPIYGVRPSRSQTHPHIALRPPFRVVWTRSVGSLLEFPAVVYEGVAYVANYRGTVRAISMRTGKVAWRRETPNGKMAASPAVVGDDLVVHGMDGHVWVLDRSSGAIRWRFRIGSPIESSPVVRDGIDYFGAWNGTVYALDLRRRRLVWRFRSRAKITSSASLAGRTLYIGNYRGRLLALSSATGRLRFARSVDGRIYGTPAVVAGRIYVPSSTGRSLTAFSTAGRRLWRVETGGYVYSSAAVWGGRVFFGSYDGRLYCVSARTGRVRWRVAAGGPISGAVAVVAGVAYAGSTANRIVGVDARSGRVLLRFPHGEYVPVSGNGGRLLLHGYARLYAVEPRR